VAGPARSRRGGAARDGRRERLVAAGLKLFSERPYDEISIDDLATEAAVAHGLLSYYFKGKRGLYLEVLRLVQSDLAAITRPHASDGSRADQVRGMTRRHFEYFRAHPQLMLGLLASAPHDATTSAIVRQTELTGRGIWLAMLGVPEDPPPSMRIALEACMGHMHYITIDWLTHGQDVPIDDLVELCYDTMAAALASARKRQTAGSGRRS
jgi:AcrR family transcriptional regulator